MCQRARTEAGIKIDYRFCRFPSWETNYCLIFTWVEFCIFFFFGKNLSTREILLVILKVLVSDFKGILLYFSILYGINKLVEMVVDTGKSHRKYVKDQT